MKKSYVIMLALVMTIISVMSPRVWSFAGGDGTPGNPYLIQDFADFQAFCGNAAYWASGVCTRLDCNLDLNPALEGRQTYDKAVIAWHTDSTSSDFQGTAFAGNFNGNGHIISNLTVTGVRYCGLFGKIGSGGVVTGLGLENVSVSGTRSCIGGLCGVNSGTITRSYISGNVSGSYYYTGGLCGANDSGTIASSYSSGSVIGYGFVGGLCGYKYDGSITSSYSSGSVSGSGFVGGLCGYIYSDTITSSFWDVETSGIGVSGSNYGATGKTTAEMQILSTFTTAGWDFSTTDGDAADWAMRSGSYPLLAWQIVPGDIGGKFGVDLLDMEIMANNWLSEVSGMSSDINADNAVNLLDFAILAGNWLK